MARRGQVVMGIAILGAGGYLAIVSSLAQNAGR